VLQRDHLRLAMQHEQVRQQQRGDQRDERGPLPRGDVEGREAVFDGEGYCDRTACAAASLAMGTRNGEQLT
jgi:hypothetical protein